MTPQESQNKKILIILLLVIGGIVAACACCFIGQLVFGAWFYHATKPQ